MSLAPDPFIFDAVRDYAESHQTTPITILRGGRGALDRATGRVAGVSNPVTIWSGSARIKPVSGSSTIDLGGGEVVQRTAQISIPITAPVPRRDDIVIVGVNDVADASVDNLVFRVLGADAGGFFGDARRLDCGTFGRSRYWGGGA